jgi:hypothetical protein
VSNLNHVEGRVVHRSDVVRARTLNALEGAARGCRVLVAQWAVRSAECQRWLHHYGYEVPHLNKISQVFLCDNKYISCGIQDKIKE